MKKVNGKILTKEEILNDILTLQDKFLEEYEGIITVTYYKENGKYTYPELCSVLGGWKNALKETGLLEQEDLMIYKMQKTLQKFKNDNQKLKRQSEQAIDEIIKHESYLSEYQQYLKSTTMPKINNVILPKKPGLHGVLCLSDWHCGEEVLPETVGGINAYNTHIMIKRLDDVFNQFITHVKNFEIENVTILLLGDLLHGRIHQENERTQEINVVQSLIFVQKYIQDKLIYMLDFVKTINVYNLIGNHARIAEGKPYYTDQVSLNFEYLMGKQLQIWAEAIQQKQKRITIHCPESTFKVININGHNLLATHGDLLAGGGGGFAGIPLYGLAMSSAKMYGVLSQIGVDDETPFDSIVMGHLHTESKFKIFTGGFLYLNGCIVGTNTFSLQKVRSVASISQTMLMIDQKGSIFIDISLKTQ